jgi:DNA-binding FadR family transcriptional regulator
MLRDRPAPPLSEFLQYLASHEQTEQSLPALTALSTELGVSVASLREQLEVARALGLVEVKPRTGIRRQPYTFLPAVRQSLTYAIALDKDHFIAFADLRRHVETAYWHEAVKLLTPEDRAALKSLVARAWDKLRGSPIEIPHPEHRELHLTIYRRLDNPFVTGILLAYWDAYESVGLNVFTDYKYLTEVWTYHQKMVDSICENDFDAGYKALAEHSDLINQLISSAQ